MEISGVLAAAKFVSTALGNLVQRSEPADRAQGQPVETSATQPPPSAASQTAFQEILGLYNVKDISPRDFSEMIQKLYEAGAVTDQELQELSLVRVDLDLEGVDPDESLDLVEFYFDKLRELQAGLEDLGGSDDSTSVDRSALAASVRRRLDWLAKAAMIQSGPDAIHLDAFV